ncbi:MAG: xanthine dehydrogenase family protein subunit M [Cyclobacteriaceae bacterium]|nr:xanthine dehydrogenase family protein subunit M [Cyclobacteriaceae bacterium]
MIPSEFEYCRAGSVEEALDLLAQKGPDAKILAGGHSLLPAMKLRLNSPGAVIDISGIGELSYIKEEGSHLVIGACTTHGDIAKSTLLSEKIPMIVEAAAEIGDVQVRNKGTIGGSLAHADPAADWPASLLAGEAEIVLASSSGERTVAAVDFFQGLFTTDLGENELITEIRLPIPDAYTKSTYVKFEQPASRFAIVGCAASITRSNGSCDKVRVAFTGVSSTPFRDQAVEQALEGQAPSDDNIEAAAEKAAMSVEVMGDHFASQEYRKHLAKVYARRALQAVLS